MARDLGLPVGELGNRLSWAELLHWIALYQIEANQALPPHLRTVRPRTSEDTVLILDQVFASACSTTAS